MIHFTSQYERISFRREDFRVSLEKPCVSLAGSSLLLIEAMLIWPDENDPLLLFFQIPSVVLGLCASLLLILSMRYHLKVGPDGVDRYGLCSGVQHFSWQDVTRTHICRFLGLEYLVVKIGPRRRRIWLPLFVHRSELFLKMIQTYIDPEQQSQPLENIESAHEGALK